MVVIGTVESVYRLDYGSWPVSSSYSFTFTLPAGRPWHMRVPTTAADWSKPMAETAIRNVHYSPPATTIIPNAPLLRLRFGKFSTLHFCIVTSRTKWVSRSIFCWSFRNISIVDFSISYNNKSLQQRTILHGESCSCSQKEGRWEHLRCRYRQRYRCPDAVAVL